MLIYFGKKESDINFRRCLKGQYHEKIIRLLLILEENRQDAFSVSISCLVFEIFIFLKMQI